MGRDFGDILLEAGVIDQDQLEGYSTRAVSVSSHIGLLLIDDGIATDREIAEALGLQSDFPVVQLSQLRIPGYVAKLLPLELAERLAAIPVSVKQENGLDVLYVAFFDPTDTEAIEEVRKATGKRVKPVVASLGDLRTAIRRSFATKKPKGERKTGTDMKPVVSDISSGRIPQVPPSQVVRPAAKPEADSPWPEDGLDLPEAEMDSFDDPPPPDFPEAPVPAPAEVEIEFGDLGLGLELDFGEAKPPEESAVSGAAALDEPLFDFEEDSPAIPEGETESFEVDHDTGASGETVMDFLNLSDSRLSIEDEAISRRQQEAEQARRQASPELEDDMDFAGDSILDHPAVEVDPFTAESGADDDLADLDFEGEEVSSDEFIESWEDDNFDLAGSSGAHPAIVPKATREIPADSPPVAEVEEDFDDFDFDIPEAPEFEPGASGSFPIPSKAPEPPAVAPQPDPVAASVSSRRDDWSLDVDALFDQVNGELEEGDLAQAPDEVDFETVSRELDRLLAMDTDVDSDSDDPGGDLALELACLVTENPDPDPEDVALMARLIHGSPEPADSARLSELSRRTGGVARKLMDSGLVPKTDMLSDLLQTESKS